MTMITHSDHETRTERNGLNPIDILLDWVSVQKKESKPANGGAMSPEQEYLRARDDFQSIVDTCQSLKRALCDLNGLRIKRGRELRQMSENVSPLLSLKRLSLFHNVVGYLDGQALCFLEEAAGSVKSSKAVEDQWSYLETVCDSGGQGIRAFTRDAIFAQEMESLAGPPFEFNQDVPDEEEEGGNSDNTELDVYCTGREKFEYTRIKDYFLSSYGRQPEMLFVRLSQLRGLAKEHLIWEGYAPVQDVTVSRIALKWDIKSIDGNWPELLDYREWFERIHSGGWCFSTEYTKRMKQLIRNVRITLVRDGQLFVATGGCQRGQGENCGGKIDFRWSCSGDANSGSVGQAKITSLWFAGGGLNISLTEKHLESWSSI